MKKSFIFFFDLETTGVNQAIHGIHQISGCVVDDGQMKIVERFDFRVKPFGDDAIDQQALDVAGVTIADFSSDKYEDPGVVHRKITNMVGKYIDKFDRNQKMFLAGYNNASFDNGLFRKFFEKNGDKYFGSLFWSNSIDVMVMATAFLMNQRREMVNFKLSTVAEFMGIEVDESKLHDAQFDIELTMAIYCKVANIKPGYQ